MDRETLQRLEKLNQLHLTDRQEDELLAFLDRQYGEIAQLSAIETDHVERMVHVIPIFNVMREDAAVQNFTREELQQGAPETMDGYWQVPRLVE